MKTAPGEGAVCSLVSADEEGLVEPWGKPTPQKGVGLLRQGLDMRFEFIAKHRGIWPVSWICEALGVSRSGFHAWLVRAPGARARSDEAFGARVRASFISSYRTYGARASGTTFWPKAYHVICIASSG